MSKIDEFVKLVKEIDDSEKDIKYEMMPKRLVHQIVGRFEKLLPAQVDVWEVTYTFFKRREPFYHGYTWMNPMESYYNYARLDDCYEEDKHSGYEVVCDSKIGAFVLNKILDYEVKIPRDFYEGTEVVDVIMGKWFLRRSIEMYPDEMIAIIGRVLKIKLEVNMISLNEEVYESEIGKKRRLFMMGR